MSSSGKGGAYARDSGKADDSVPPVPDEAWQPTRAHSPLNAPSLEDEWAPTRALADASSTKR